MSNGWWFCSECLIYSKWHEFAFNEELHCGHNIDEICDDPNLTPGFNTDDQFHRARRRGFIYGYIQRWKKYHAEKKKVDLCACGKYHVLGVNIKPKNYKWKAYG